MPEPNPLMAAFERVAMNHSADKPVAMLGVDDQVVYDYAMRTVEGWLTSSATVENGIELATLMTLVVGTTMAGAEFERSRGKTDELHWEFKR